jgi:hypothetical protein
MNSGKKTKASDFVRILSFDRILTNLMLSRIVFAFDGSYNSRRIFSVSRISATIVLERYILRKAISKFLRLILRTPFAPAYPPINGQMHSLFPF